jgi:hypothetical protein
VGTASVSDGLPNWQVPNSGLDPVSGWGDMNYFGGIWILNQVQNDETGSADWQCDTFRVTKRDVQNGGTRDSERRCGDSDGVRRFTERVG